LPSFGYYETAKYRAAEEDNKDPKVTKVEVRKPNMVLISSNRILRAEKNKKFAKESRDRKRKYIQDLEIKVMELQKTVDYYKERLKSMRL
jgi:hypothetical protein